MLHPDVSGGSHEGVLAVHSLSKRSNLAGYRAGFVAGDPRAGRRAARGPQAPRAASCPDRCRPRWWPRSTTTRTCRCSGPGTRRGGSGCSAALSGAGFTVEHSDAGLYLWATRGETCWDTVARLAELGILVAPGEFYGAGGARHVRIALTATDERVDAAVARLS